MSKKKNIMTLASPLAPEDVRPDSYIAIHTMLFDLPLWCLDADDLRYASSPPPLIKRVPRNAGKPYKVKAVCLPYVYALAPDGKPLTLDLRRCRLVRLDDQYGRMVFQAMKAEAGRRKKDDDDDDDD
ncbi:MAG: hypothetical protein O7G85_06965 [Planctomycetota bacterium]|nr:hypothetical protein [Planctomycetota bacterium]